MIRQSVTESLVLTTIGAGGGIVLAQATLHTLIALCPTDVVRLEDTRIGPLVLLFAVGLALVTGIVLGLIPLLQLRRSVASGLHEAGCGASRASTGVRGLLVAGEIALAATLVIGATLLVRSLVALQSTDVGIERPASP